MYVLESHPKGGWGWNSSPREKLAFIERVRPQEPQRDQAARHVEKHGLATGRKVYLPGDAHLIDDIQMLLDRRVLRRLCSAR